MRVIILMLVMYLVDLRSLKLISWDPTRCDIDSGVIEMLLLLMRESAGMLRIDVGSVVGK
jgi:hypothetical protein